MYVAEASHTDPKLLAYTWYKRYVVEGAREHGLPEGYIAQLEAVPAIDDLDAHRAAQNLALFELKANS